MFLGFYTTRYYWAGDAICMHLGLCGLDYDGFHETFICSSLFAGCLRHLGGQDQNDG